MKLALALVLVSLPLAGRAHAPPTGAHGSAHLGGPPGHGAPPPAHVPVHIARPLPMLPTIARVRIETARDRLVVTEEVALPRGEWQSGALDLYVAFGAPGTPVAVDAHLAAVPVGQQEARADDPGDPVGVETAVRHTPSSQLLLGRASMAGFVVHVKDAELRHAYALSDLLLLRIRSLLPPPPADATGARDVVVRLGAPQGQPITLEKVQLLAAEPRAAITRAEATLCGPEADAWPLSIAVQPRPAETPSPRTIAPAMALRHPGDDLCVRWWTPPGP